MKHHHSMKISSKFIIACLIPMFISIISNTDKEKPRQALFRAASRHFDIMVAPAIASIENKLETTMRNTALHVYIVSGHDMQRVSEGVDISKEESLHWMETVWLEQLTTAFFNSDNRLASMRNSTFNFLERQKHCGGDFHGCMNHTQSIVMPETMLVVNRAVRERHSFLVDSIGKKLDCLEQELHHEDMLIELEAQQILSDQSLIRLFLTLLFAAGVAYAMIASH